MDGGILPSFDPKTEDIRNSEWSVRPIPNNLKDRRVEITGPVDRKMIINALNSNVNVFMADFEDSLSPSWENIQNGLINMRDAAHRTISFQHRVTLKKYNLRSNPAILMCRVRGLHLKEKHISCNGVSLYGALVDFVMYLYHNHKALEAFGSGPYFYIPKLQSYHEAKLWNDIISFCEDELKLKRGTVRVTCLIETLPAVFQMEEILYHLKDHIIGLNCGRWDYIFSFIKTLQSYPEKLLPDRNIITMNQPFLTSYSTLLVNTCHKRGAFAMGGMAAQIPVKDDDEKNNAAFNKVKMDKEREVKNGHDGTWVAHPGLVPIALDVFSTSISGENQLDVSLDNINITQEDLLEVHKGEKTEDGMRECIRVGIQYIAAWLGGRGAVPLYNLMEDAATAEISRAQIWQWLKHSTSLNDGRTVTIELFQSILEDEINALKEIIGENQWKDGKYEKAIELFEKMSISPDCEEFLTLSAYEEVISLNK